MKKSSVCPKCDSGEMIQGFLPEFTHTAVFVTGWQEGNPKKSLWTRTKASPRKTMPVGAFRCNRCGYLEFFANPDFAAK